VDAGLRELASHWRDLGVRRISLYNGLIENEGWRPRKQRFRSAVTKRRRSPILLPYGQQLTQKDVSWETCQQKSTTSLRTPKKHWALDRSNSSRRHGALTWRRGERFSGAVEPCVARAKSGGVALVIENTPPLYANMHLAHTLRRHREFGEPPALASASTCSRAGPRRD